MANPSPIVEAEDHLLGGNKLFAGKYTLERIIGEGGMGKVFEARHARLHHSVAIKVLSAELCGQPEVVQRFEREARACDSLSSAHAVHVSDIDATENGTPFIVMELLSGRDLGQVVERQGRQPIARSVRWILEACDAIGEAHQLGIVHRDLKPSNLFLVDAGDRTIVKVLDFGIAKDLTSDDAALTRTLAPLGTPHYMSPEQIRCAKNVDGRTDIWSLGVTLYELVTGTTPYLDVAVSACIAAIAADPVPDPRERCPELPEAFVDALMRALVKDPDARYQTIEELVASLSPFAAADDEPALSLTRRVRRQAPESPTTQPASARSRGLRALTSRERLDSGADRTVPPSIALVTRWATDPARRRPALAIGAAGALCVAVLTATVLFRPTTTRVATAAPAEAAVVATAAPPEAEVLTAVTTASPSSPSSEPAPSSPSSEPAPSEPTPRVVKASRRRVLHAPAHARKRAARSRDAAPAKGVAPPSAAVAHGAEARHPWW